MTAPSLRWAMRNAFTMPEGLIIEILVHLRAKRQLTSSGKARGRCYTVYCLLSTVDVNC